MKRKLLSLLLSAAMFIGALPAVSLAASSAAAKLGVENGDIVRFAGKDGTPVKWRIIDGGKSNTGNSNGMLLLSEDTLYGVTLPQTPPATDELADWLNDDCNNFYTAYFGDLYKKAVMTVSKTDSGYTINSNDYTDRLPAGTTVFALSAEEFKGLPNNLKNFSNTTMWWLRSVCHKKPGVMLSFSSYSYVNKDGAISSIATSSTKIPTDAKLRPAVNLDKDKLAKIGDKILLLPTGENYGSLAPVGTADEWKLSVKNDTSVTAHTEHNTEDSLELNIKTNQTNDYISVIIVKKNGSISHYGRYKQIEQNIRVTLPSDIDMKTDSMYVFAEDYNGALSGSASTPVKVCIEHKFNYTSENDSAHTAKCSVCNYEVKQSHSWGGYTYNDTEHSQSCSVCGFVKTENHTLSYSQNDTKTHNASCVCGFKAENLEHTYNIKMSDSPEIFTCSGCGAIHFTALCGMFGGMALRSEYKAGSAALNGEKSASADSIFTDNNAGGTVNADGTGVATLTFDTKRPIRAEGFQIRLSETDRANLPKTITLYGKNAETDAYEEIETAALRSLFDEGAVGGTYSFVFTAKPEFTAYESFMIEMDFGQPNLSADFTYFGLISSPAIAAVNLNLTGILATDAPDVMYPGEDYIATFISGMGYPAARYFTVGLDNSMLGNDCWEYSPETGTMRIPSKYIKENTVCEIIGFCGDKVAVGFDSQTLRLAGGDSEALFGKEYVAEFQVISGKQELAPKSLDDITVTNKNGDVTYLCTLDSDGRLHIPGELLIGGVGDFVKISAEETGIKLPPERAAVKVTKSDNVDRYFSSPDDAKAVIELDGDTDITVLKNISTGEPITLNGKKVNINLGGNTITSTAGETVFNIESGAEVSISNGAFSADGSTNVIKVNCGGVLTLDNVITPETDRSVYVEYPGKLVLEGANSDVSVYLNGGIFEQSDGASRIFSNFCAVRNIRLYGGTVKKCNVGKIDPFTMIDDGYVFEISDTGKFTDFVMGITNNIAFSVKRGDIITEQPQDINAECGESARITIGAAEGSEYYWFDPEDSVRIRQSGNNYMGIGASTSAGEYSYRCAVLTGNTVAMSRTAKVTVTCSHKSVADGVCDKCGAKMAAQVTADDKTVNFEDIYDAVSFAGENENAKITLLNDVTIDNYMDFAGRNVTLDMNGKTIDSADVNRFITVSAGGTFTIIGNGNMKARFRAEEKCDLVIENGAFEDIVFGGDNILTVNSGSFAMLGLTGGKAIVNGGTFTKLIIRAEAVLNGGVFAEISGNDFYRFLPDGKAFAGADDGKFNTAEYEYYKGIDSCIKNVTIADAPFVITRQPKGRFIAEGATDASVSVGVTENETYKGKIAYKWIVGTMSYEDEEFTVEKEGVGDAAAAIIDTTGLGGGVQKTYQCIVSYEGYEVKTELATFTIGKGIPVADLDEGYINSYGNDCLLIAAAYDGGALSETYTMNLSKDDTFIDIDTALEPFSEKLDDNVDKIKIFIWDNLNSMIPMTKTAE